MSSPGSEAPGGFEGLPVFSETDRAQEKRLAAWTTGLLGLFVLWVGRLIVAQSSGGGAWWTYLAGATGIGLFATAIARLDDALRLPLRAEAKVLGALLVTPAVWLDLAAPVPGIGLLGAGGWTIGAAVARRREFLGGVGMGLSVFGAAVLPILPLFVWLGGRGRWRWFGGAALGASGALAAFWVGLEHWVGARVGDGEVVRYGLVSGWLTGAEMVPMEGGGILAILPDGLEWGRVVALGFVGLILPFVLVWRMRPGFDLDLGSREVSLASAWAVAVLVLVLPADGAFLLPAAVAGFEGWRRSSIPLVRQVGWVPCGIALAALTSVPFSFLRPDVGLLVAALSLAPYFVVPGFYPWSPRARKPCDGGGEASCA